MTRATPTFLVALALAALATLASPASAAGCSGGRMLEEGTSAFDAADMVFTGTVVRRDEPFNFGAGVTGSADPIGWTFVVESVENGPQVKRVRVESPRADASCGVEFKLGQRYRILAHESFGGSLTAIQGDATQLEPLPDALRPPTEPGGLTFPISIEVLGLAALLAVLLAVVAWRALDAHRRSARTSAR